MQFKIVLPLVFATVATAAGNLPLSRFARDASTNIAPPSPGNPLPTLSPSQCKSGDLQCCKSTQSPTAPSVVALLDSLDISGDNISGLVGLTCTSIVAGANSCSAHPVCCIDNSFGGVISLACNPVNLNL